MAAASDSSCRARLRRARRAAPEVEVERGVAADRSCAATSACRGRPRTRRRQRRGDAARVQRAGAREQRRPVEGRGREESRRPSRPVVEGRARARALSDLDEEETEPAVRGHCDARPCPRRWRVRARRARTGRAHCREDARPRRRGAPSRASATATLSSAPGDPERRTRRLLEPLQPGRRESQHRLAERDDASFPTDDEAASNNLKRCFRSCRFSKRTVRLRRHVHPSGARLLSSAASTSNGVIGRRLSRVADRVADGVRDHGRGRDDRRLARRP